MSTIAKTIRGINVKIGSDTSGLGKALKDVNKKSRDIRSELRKVERLLKFNPKDTELLAQKQQLLSDRVANTSEKLNRLKSVQGQVNEQFKAGEIGAQQYRDFQRELIKTNSKLKTFERQLEDSSSSGIELGKNLDKLENKLNGIGNSLSTKITAPVLGAFTALTEGTRNFRKEISVLENNVDSAGANMDNMSKAMKQMQGVTGELDSNVEGLSNLLASGFKGDKFQQVLDELSGAAIKFKDTLKFESIADGLQETLATGSAVGQFGELLERSGIQLDVFNKGLQEAIKNGEEQNYVLQTLAKTGLADVYESYRRNNKELVESAEANYRLKQSFAEMGQELEPIMTNIKEVVAETVGEFNELDEGTKELIIQATGVTTALGPVVVVLGQITTAVSALTIALGTLELAFAPFAIGAAIVSGLAYIAKKFFEAREEAELLNKEISKLASIDEAGERLEVIDKRISRTKKQMETLTDEQGNLLNPANKQMYENWQKRLNNLLDERHKTLMTIRGLELGEKVQAQAKAKEKAERKVLSMLREKNLAYRAGRLEKKKYKSILEDIIADESKSNAVVARAKSLLESLSGFKIKTPTTEDDFEKEWQNKLVLAKKEGLEKELEQLRQQREQALEIANKKGKDTSAIVGFYQLEEQKIRNKYLELEFRQAIEHDNKLRKQREKKNSERIKAESEAYQAEIEAGQKAAEKKKKLLDNRMKYDYKQNKISAEDYKKYLQSRLSEYKEYSDEWISTREKITEIEKGEIEQQQSAWDGFLDRLEEGNLSKADLIQSTWKMAIDSINESLSTTNEELDKLANADISNLVDNFQKFGKSTEGTWKAIGSAVGTIVGSTELGEFAAETNLKVWDEISRLGDRIFGGETSAANWNKQVGLLKEEYQGLAGDLVGDFDLNLPSLADLVDDDIETVTKKIKDGGWFHSDDWAEVLNFPEFKEAFDEQIKKIEEEIVPKLQDIFSNVTSGLNSAFSADSYTSFLSSFGSSLKDTVFNNLKEAFMQSQAIQPLMKKLTGTIYEATKDQVLDDSEREAIKTLYDEISKISGDFYNGLQDISDDLSIDLGAGDTSSSSGGSQISEITGSTRDLFTDLLTPLANFPSLLNINERIYNQLVAMSQNGLAIAGAGGYDVSVRIENLNVESQSNSSQSIANASVSDIESAIATAIGDGKRGRGR
ncbi:hypothetical protein [Orenia marismortui]|uniref:Phage-related minor tail protein n=1 Tax=Orenia marismortui TaxID=46469 RepID=A0A4R8GZG2_9FIRM|nr:hypothetical protein [Orenia marismortui]TDX52137.1 hypothetical protein C7959_10859 [Orenia marismortui]